MYLTQVSNFLYCLPTPVCWDYYNGGMDMNQTKLKQIFLSLCASIVLGTSLSAIPVFCCQKVDTAKSEIFFTISEFPHPYFPLTPRGLPDTFNILVDGQRIAPLFQKKYIVKLEDGRSQEAIDMLVSYERVKSMTAKVNRTTCYFKDVFGNETLRDVFDIPDVVTRYERLKREKYPEQNANVWLLLDRSTEGDDNAEHFYRFLRTQHSRDVTPYFTINKMGGDGKDNSYWNKLSKEGFQLLALKQEIKQDQKPALVADDCRAILDKASKIISSQSAEALKIRYGPDFLRFKHFIFLQHGVIKDDMSEWINGKEMDLFVTTTFTEFNSIVGKGTPYKTLPAHGKMLGLPRHDTLLHRYLNPGCSDNQRYAKDFARRVGEFSKKNKGKKLPEKAILIMPTWRKHVKDVTDGIKNADQMFKTFQGTNYFEKWNGFLTDKSLTALAQKYSYRIIFFPHSLMRKFLSKWTLPGIEKVTCFNRSIQDVFLESAVMITDYSSTAFEMALLRRPVIYYQFDNVTTQGAHTYQSGYFDYLRDGFGPVVGTRDKLFQALETLLQNECQPEQKYLECMQQTFVFRDEGNCERVYRAIRELDVPRAPWDFDREVLSDYAQAAEREGDREFAQKCQEKLTR